MASGNCTEIDDKLKDIQINSEIDRTKVEENELDGGPAGKVTIENEVAPSHFLSLTKPEDEDYSTNYEKRGYCVIFNHKLFKPNLQMNERSGTDRDRDRIRQLFKAFGFTVEICDDFEVKKIKEKINDYAYQVDHSKCDCFVMVFMSHGEEGQLYGCDNIFKAEDLFSNFTADNCPSLAGKPKMFFIQACRGDGLDSGVELIARTATDQTDNGALSMYKIPNHADFLVCWSTIPGFDHASFLKEKGARLSSSLSNLSVSSESDFPFGTHSEKAESSLEKETASLDSSVECTCQLVSSNDTLEEDETYSCPACRRGHYSWRNTTNGSWFIQCVVKVFGYYANSLDVLSMMTYVNRSMSLNFESNCPGSSNMHGRKQSAYIVSTLLRRVFLKSKK